MNMIATFVAERKVLARLTVVITAILVGIFTSVLVIDVREKAHLERLSAESERCSIEILSTTLNSNLIAAVAVLGLIDPAVKQEANGVLEANNPAVLSNLESIGRSYNANGVFIVSGSGIITSSWDSAGKPSTNLDVKFRPYYQMAMRGLDNVYAAVSLGRGDRSLYFSAPIYTQPRNGTLAIGAIVARTSLLKVDELLSEQVETALLLSPQGVVFASSRPELVGQLAGESTPERLRTIRELKQFGTMFERDEPKILDLPVDDGRHRLDGRRLAVVTAKVGWNDPYGDWTLVMIDDMGTAVPISGYWAVGALVALASLLVGLLVLNMLGYHHAQQLDRKQLEDLALSQGRTAARKTRVAEVTLRLQRSKDMDSLIQTFLKDSCTLVDALQGVVYLGEAGRNVALHLAGTYACGDPPPETLVPGEGLLGQCVLDRRIVCVDTGIDAFVTIHSGLGETRPSCVLLAPVMLNETLLGVIELALLHPISEEDTGSFSEIVGLLAMNIEIVRRSTHNEEVIAAALATEQANSERLAFQQNLIDAIPTPVFYKDADSLYLGVNKAFEESFGKTNGMLVGRRVIDCGLMPDEEARLSQAEDEVLIAQGGKVQHETRIPYLDGTVHEVLYFASSFHRPDGAPGGMVGTFIDISAVKKAERELSRMTDLERLNSIAMGREARILELKEEINDLCARLSEPARYGSTGQTGFTEIFIPADRTNFPAASDFSLARLDQLVDLADLQSLLTNFCDSVGIAAAIIDLQGKVLVSARWQYACTEFHRKHPVSCARCIESDTGLALELEAGSGFTMYKCKNGMVDAAAPIVVEGKNLANVFIGQFHGSLPDLDFFRAQATLFGYDETAYLEAVAAAPVIDETRLPAILSFLSGFARMISTTSLARHRADLAQTKLREQSEQLQRERGFALSIAEDARHSGDEGHVGQEEPQA